MQMGEEDGNQCGYKAWCHNQPISANQRAKREVRELKRANEIVRRACPTKCFGHNALAETINGLYKAEVIHKDGPWRGLDDVERATLTWVDRFNHRRLLRSIGDLPSAEFEMMYY